MLLSYSNRLNAKERFLRSVQIQRIELPRAYPFRGEVLHTLSAEFRKRSGSRLLFCAARRNRKSYRGDVFKHVRFVRYAGGFWMDESGRKARRTGEGYRATQIPMSLNSIPRDTLHADSVEAATLCAKHFRSQRRLHYQNRICSW